MQKTKEKGKDVRIALFVSFLCCIFFGLLIVSYFRQTREIWKKDEQARLERVLTNKRSGLENNLYARIYYTKSVAAYVSLHPDLSDGEFYNLAAELIGDDPLINTMALSKDGIIGAVFPREGHEEAIGLNLFEHAERKEMVKKTIETGKTFVAGPVELVEGGIAFISYTPVFDKTGPPPPSFWGIADIVIKREEFFEAADLKKTEQGASFAVRGYDGLGERGAVFFGDPSIFERDPATVKIELPDGEWILAAIPQNGWAGYLDQDKALLGIVAASGAIIAVLIGLFASAIARIRRDARHMDSIFKAMSGSVLQLDSRGTVEWMAPTRHELPIPAAENGAGDYLLQGLLDAGSRNSFEQAMDRCLGEKTVIPVELKLADGEPPLWMLATLSPKDSGKVIAVSQEITRQKEQQARLETSERELRRLNEDKDLLFSMIAHDLRSPASAIVSLSEELLDRGNSQAPDQQRRMLELLYESGKENLSLLENLLAWARSQQEGLVVDRDTVPLRALVEDVWQTFRENAAHKGVTFDVQVPGTLQVEFDRDMLKTILRNLISNALKFTESGGRVEIGFEEDASIGPCVFVRDTGVGMTPESARQLSALGNPGSPDGAGSGKRLGFGMRLCHVFVAKHGQELRIESAPGKGTIVYFSVPVVSGDRKPDVGI